MTYHAPPHSELPSGFSSGRNRKTKIPRQKENSVKEKSKSKNMVVTPIVNLWMYYVSEQIPNQDYDSSKSFQLVTMTQKEDIEYDFTT